MADVKVTREHREAAIAAWNGPNPPRVVLAVKDVVKPWLETGEPTRGGGPMDGLTRALQRIAETVAHGEHRVRSAVLADLRGLLECSEFIGPVDYVQADSIRNLIETLEDANAG